MMHVQWHELKFNFLVLDVLFEGAGSFVIKSLESQFEAPCFKVLVKGSICLQHFSVGAVAHWLCQDGIAVIVIQHHHIFVALT